MQNRMPFGKEKVVVIEIHQKKKFNTCTAANILATCFSVSRIKWRQYATLQRAIVRQYLCTEVTVTILL